ncbi:MAG: bifunctional hydroxymethylpyrimidine kinase/phosphomethylpyrimidine kinase [Bacteroidia bacterium]|nr:bifunctional hydroxymethylpyrimidine kinase/phosphomethylpyrimidine kinase [Bacteroidia bacterium]
MGLLTVGTVAFDTIETPNGKAENVVGGAALYAGLSASYFTNEVNIVSVIGGDYDDDTLELMKSRGMNLDGIQVKPGEKSFFWAGKYHDNMNARDTLTTELNVLADFDPVLPPHYSDDEYILLGNLTPDVQINVLDQLTSKPKLVVLDTMNFWMDIAMERLREAISRIDVLTINDEEARQLSGEYSLVKAAEVIRKMGPKTLIVKKGEHGALLFQDNQIFFAPALPLAEVFDPTGAGDTFAGGFIGYLVRSGDTSFESMKTAIIYGSAMASFCVERFSIERLKNLETEEIENRVQKFRDLVKF